MDKIKFIFIFFSFFSCLMFASEINLPEKIGSVKDFSQPNINNNKNVVIVIQNAPFNVEVQRNIFSILPILKIK